MISLIGLGYLAFCWTRYDSVPVVLGIGTVAVIASVLLLVPKLFFPHRHYLHLTSHGFTINSLFRKRFYPWTDITSDFRVIRAGIYHMIGFDLAEDSPFQPSSFSKSLDEEDDPDVTFVAIYELRVEELTHLLNACREYFAERS